MSEWIYEYLPSPPIIKEFSYEEIITALKIAGFLLETDYVTHTEPFKRSVFV